MTLTTVSTTVLYCDTVMWPVAGVSSNPVVVTCASLYCSFTPLPAAGSGVKLQYKLAHVTTTGFELTTYGITPEHLAIGLCEQ